MKKKPAKKAKSKKVTRKPVKKVKPKVKVKSPKPVGKVTHYFGDISVAIVRVLGSLKSGDQIRIVGGEKTDFEQPVKSMQFNHKEIKRAKKGQSIGLKVKEIVRDGYGVYKA